MFVRTVFFLCGIVQIIGRSYNDFSKTNFDDTLEHTPPWPHLKQMYLLPKKLKVDDIINITAVIKNTPLLNISLITENKTSTDSSKALCTLMADMTTGIVKILDDNGNPLTDIDDDVDLSHFHLNGDETIFNVWFRRRSTQKMHNNNVIEIRSHSFTATFVPKYDVDDIRYLKFTGQNVQVTELEFKFAVH